MVDGNVCSLWSQMGLYQGPMWSYDGDSSDEEGDVPPFLEPQISQSLHNVITQESEEPTSTSFNRPFDEMGDLLSQAVWETEGLEDLMCNTGTQDIEPSSEISTLWNGLSVSDMAELEQASDSPLQIEQLHNARPSRTCPAPVLYFSSRPIFSIVLCANQKLERNTCNTRASWLW